MKATTIGIILLGGLLIVCAWPSACSGAAVRGHLETNDLPAFLQDRGEGVPLSMFGTYIQKGQLIVYPFMELYRDRDYEYAPNELGFEEDVDYRGDYEASEQLILIGYGFTDRLAVEFEAAVIQAELEKARNDRSGVPEEVEESGLGDVEGQLRWRWARETAGRPEIFSYFEAVLPTQDEGSLIGTTDWEFKLGSGVIRGFGWGTLTARGAFEYDRSEDKFELGELAFEYLKRLSPRWRVYGGVEGTQDEIELITEAQWHFARRVFLKLNNAFGLTSKAADWAPEFGFVFSF
ncbi:MAG: hypothetical protein GF355_16730 [Candidatus Eisenbacteria bacterium]|nr:hypothetical protein [Candidatus Eisenbacteria bacterium]